jgi:hypothetical protein
MNGLSIRMILFIVVLSALHISGITPVKHPAIQLPQEAPLRPTVQTRDSVSPHQAVSNPGSRLGTKAPQEIAQLDGDLRRTI